MLERRRRSTRAGSPTRSRSDVVAEVAADDVDAERQRQARLEQPPLAEVEALLEARRRGTSAVPRGSAGRRAPRPAATSGRISSNGSTRYANSPPSAMLQHEERRRQLARDDDLRLAQLVERQRLARDDDRAVARADAARRAAAARSGPARAGTSRATSRSPRAAPRAPTRSASGCPRSPARTRSRAGRPCPTRAPRT